jgi:hypothetical protein
MYAEHRAALVQKADGKFVFIYGQEIADTYSEKMDAIAEGYRRFGNVHFS